MLISVSSTKFCIVLFALSVDCWNDKALKLYFTELIFKLGIYNLNVN